MSERLSAWEVDHFLAERRKGMFRPNNDWAAVLWKSHLHENAINIFEPIPTKAPNWAEPYVCLNVTVQFLGRRRPFEEIDRVDLESRTWPTRHFAERAGIFYEVYGGRVQHNAGSWFMVWRAAMNTELARHLNSHPKHAEWDGGRCELCAMEKTLKGAAA